MASADTEVLTAGATIHRDVGRNERSSLQLHRGTIETIRRVRDAINEAAGAKVVTNDDLVRLAFHSLGRISVISEEPSAADDHDEQVMIPLADVVRDSTGPEEWLPDSYADDSPDTED